MENKVLPAAFVWEGMDIGLVTLDLETGRLVAVQLRQVLRWKSGPKTGQTEKTPWCQALPEQLRDFAAKLVEKAEEAERTDPLSPTFQ